MNNWKILWVTLFYSLFSFRRSLQIKFSFLPNEWKRDKSICGSNDRSQANKCSKTDVGKSEHCSVEKLPGEWNDVDKTGEGENSCLWLMRYGSREINTLYVPRRNVWTSNATSLSKYDARHFGILQLEKPNDVLNIHGLWSWKQ